MQALIAVLPGDGIGPEVAAEAVKVLQTVGTKYGHEFRFEEASIGGVAIDCLGNPLPDETIQLCRKANAVFLGAVGGPKWSHLDKDVRPEQGLLGIRKELGLFTNLRPVQVHPSLRHLSPLKEEKLQNVDMLIVRELTGGIYFGEKTRTETMASDLCVYTVPEIERITRVACRIAMGRRKKVTSVDKANVLETSRLWQSVCGRVVKKEFPEIELEHVLADAAAMYLIQDPSQFDVILTENMFGDILSDEASMISGSMGLMPSASLGEGQFGLFEPIHGSAPTLVGKNIANPYAAILSAAMLLRHSLGLESEADAVEAAVHTSIDEGFLTADLINDESPSLSTSEISSAVIERLF